MVSRLANLTLSSDVDQDAYMFGLHERPLAHGLIIDEPDLKVNTTIQLCFGDFQSLKPTMCSSLFWYGLLYVLTSFAIVLTRKRETVAMLMSYYYKCPVNLPRGDVGGSAVCDSVFC